MIKQKIKIPKGWESMKLGDIADVKNGKSNTQDAISDGKYLFFDRSALIKKSSKYLFDAEAIILPGEGAEFLPRYYKGKFDLHQRAYSIISKNHKADSRYLFYFLFAKRNVFVKKSVGSTVKSLRLPMIQSFPVVLPPLPEQSKIAEILSKVDEDIEKTEWVIKNIEKLKKGLMRELLTKGIGHKKFKKTKLGEIPEDWEIKDFIEVAVLQRGFDLPANKRNKGDYSLVSSNGITDLHNEYKVRAPGVVTGRSGTIGKVFYIENDFWPLNTTLYIKDFKGNNEKFIYYFLQRLNIQDFYTGTGVPTLNRNNIHVIKVAIPMLSEQKQIAEILSSVDDKIQINKQIKNKLTQLKKGLMGDLLSGRVRVV